MEKTNATAYVLLSGGQDSFTCLLWALENFNGVEAISIGYGQRHKMELNYAAELAKYFDVPHKLYDIGDFLAKTVQSSLLGTGDHNGTHQQARHLPASFVPNRNGLFLTIAANHAYAFEQQGIHIVIGACQTDYSGYPDCRDAYIKAKEVELSLGLDLPVTVHTPLMWMNKAETFFFVYQRDKLEQLNSFTLTCYNGNETLQEWGRGCGMCPSCKLRQKGYQDFLQMVPSK